MNYKVWSRRIWKFTHKMTILETFGVKLKLFKVWTRGEIEVLKQGDAKWNYRLDVLGLGVTFGN